MASRDRPEKKRAPASRKCLTGMLTIVPVLIVAVLCYTASVYAWFTLHVSNLGSTIEAAGFTLQVTVSDSVGVPLTPAGESYALKAGAEYSVKLVASGGATGYCVISGGSSDKYTAAFASGDSFTFTLIPEHTGNYSFQAHWGTPPQTDITAGGTLGVKGADPGNDASDPAGGGDTTGTDPINSDGTTGTDPVNGGDTTGTDPASGGTTTGTDPANGGGTTGTDPANGGDTTGTNPANGDASSPADGTTGG